MQRRLGQPVLVENRLGAGNGIAAGAVATCEPDGHTLVLSPDTVLKWHGGSRSSSGWALKPN